MQSNQHILIAGRNTAALAKAAAPLEARAGLRVSRRHIENGSADPLQGLGFVPDVLIYVLDEHGHRDLASLAAEQTGARPPLVVVAASGDATTMRLAMQAGARDFLPGPVDDDDLIASVERVSAQTAQAGLGAGRRVTSFVNAKGGSGATFLACNTAHVLSLDAKDDCALLSLDMQFESLVQHFDIDMRHGLLQVLDSVESLDETALDAFMTHHESGLRLLAARFDPLADVHPDKAAALGHLIDKMASIYEHLIIDMPRRLDACTLVALERSSRIVVVVQQTLAHLRDAVRLLQIYRAHGVSSENLLVVVNRFEKNAAITMDDLHRALPDIESCIVPSDFKTVAETINLGVPIFEHARNSPVTRAIKALEARIAGTEAVEPSGLFARTLAGFRRRETWSRS